MASLIIHGDIDANELPYQVVAFMYDRSSDLIREIGDNPDRRPRPKTPWLLI